MAGMRQPGKPKQRCGETRRQTENGRVVGLRDAGGGGVKGGRVEWSTWVWVGDRQHRPPGQYYNLAGSGNEGAERENVLP